MQSSSLPSISKTIATPIERHLPSIQHASSSRPLHASCQEPLRKTCCHIVLAADRRYRSRPTLACAWHVHCMGFHSLVAVLGRYEYDDEMQAHPLGRFGPVHPPDVRSVDYRSPDEEIHFRRRKTTTHLASVWLSSGIDYCLFEDRV